MISDETAECVNEEMSGKVPFFLLSNPSQQDLHFTLVVPNTRHHDLAFLTDSLIMYIGYLENRLTKIKRM